MNSNHKNLIKNQKNEKSARMISIRYRKIRCHLSAFSQADNLRRRGPAEDQPGFSLLELLVAVLLLAMISAMIYSVLNVGIKFSHKGEAKILATERNRGFLALLHQQVNSAWYNIKSKKIEISADGDILRLITRHPLFSEHSGPVLAVYRYNDAEQTVYYMEKKDFYNPDYDDEFVPAFDEMFALLQTDHDLILEYDPEIGEVAVEYEGTQYIFIPRCLEGKS